MGGILSGVSFSRFAGTSGYRIRPSNCILVLRSLDVGFVRLPVITGDCCDGITHVGFAELKETADDRANIGGTIIGGPILGQQLAQYILTDHQDADCRPMIRLNGRLAYIGPMFRLILFRQSLVCLHWTNVWVTIDPVICSS